MNIPKNSYFYLKAMSFVVINELRYVATSVIPDIMHPVCPIWVAFRERVVLYYESHEQSWLLNCSILLVY